ncbi:hypothetical protein T4A_11357, partial [Trichinella pseudospiralis]
LKTRIAGVFDNVPMQNSATSVNEVTVIAHPDSLMDNLKRSSTDNFGSVRRQALIAMKVSSIPMAKARNGVTTTMLLNGTLA